MSEEIEKVKEVILTKVSLNPNETLFVTVKSDDLGAAELQNLGEGLRSLFPNNKVIVINVATGDEFSLTVLKDDSNIEQVCCGGNCHSEGENHGC